MPPSQMTAQPEDPPKPPRGQEPPRDPPPHPAPCTPAHPQPLCPRGTGATCGPEVSAGVDLDLGRLAAVLGEVEVHGGPQRGSAQQQQEAAQRRHGRLGGTLSRLAPPLPPPRFIYPGGRGLA